jgi:hypothetical protein
MVAYVHLLFLLRRKPHSVHMFSIEAFGCGSSTTVQLRALFMSEHSGEKTIILTTVKLLPYVQEKRGCMADQVESIGMLSV